MRPRTTTGRRLIAAAQLGLLALMVGFLSACGALGPGDGTGSAADFFTSRRTDIFLRGFFARPANPNAPGTPVTAWSPFHQDVAAPDSVDKSGGRVDDSQDIISGSFSQFYLDDVFAVFTISNGISARLDQVALQFTEIDGTPIIDFNVTPPTTTLGRFDYPIRSSISLIANPITSIGQPLAEPIGNPTAFAIPINIFKSGIFKFMAGQPATNVRPLLCKLTFTGRDVLDNPFTVVGFLIVSPILQNPIRTQTGGGGAGAIP